MKQTLSEKSVKAEMKAAKLQAKVDKKWAKREAEEDKKAAKDQKKYDKRIAKLEKKSRLTQKEIMNFLEERMNGTVVEQNELLRLLRNCSFVERATKSNIQTALVRTEGTIQTLTDLKWQIRNLQEQKKSKLMNQDEY